LIEDSDNRHEIYTGMANACFNNWQYLEAERYYLMAGRWGNTEKVHESLAWVQGHKFKRTEQAL
jgi:hypothetical protein